MTTERSALIEAVQATALRIQDTNLLDETVERILDAVETWVRMDERKRWTNPSALIVRAEVAGDYVCSEAGCLNTARWDWAAAFLCDAHDAVLNLSLANELLRKLLNLKEGEGSEHV